MSPRSGETTLDPSFNFLELTLISAQDLVPAPRSVHTYAVTFLHPSRRLRTRLDKTDPDSPTWNDKFLFRVDHSTFHSDTSAIQIDVYSHRPRLLPAPDTLLGTTRVVLSTLDLSSSTEFFALQIRRPNSLRPQGILNIGIGLVSPCVCGLDLYANLRTSAFAYRDLNRDAVSRKGRRKEGAGPQPAQQVDRVGSVGGGGSGERERVVLEGKLKKWRSEIWAVEDEMGAEIWAAADDDVVAGSRKGRMRRPRAMSCFNLSGQLADEVEEDDDSSRSSWSCNSH